MDAPLITLDPSANTTDVYAFRSRDNGVDYLTVALAVYPFEEPGIGPNKYNFDDNVLYEIHVAVGNDVAAGRASLTYQFMFDTDYKNEGTILQSYLGVIQNVDDAAQNLTQSYSVVKVDNRGKRPNRGAQLFAHLTERQRLRAEEERTDGFRNTMVRPAEKDDPLHLLLAAEMLDVISAHQRAHAVSDDRDGPRGFA